MNLMVQGQTELKLRASANSLQSILIADHVPFLQLWDRLEGTQSNP
jgi:hypothetical protein